MRQQMVPSFTRLDEVDARVVVRHVSLDFFRPCRHQFIGVPLAVPARNPDRITPQAPRIQCRPESL